MLFPENHAFGASLDFVSPKSGGTRGEQFLRRILAPNALGSGGTWHWLSNRLATASPRLPQVFSWRTYMCHPPFAVVGASCFSYHLCLCLQLFTSYFLSTSICPCSLCSCILCCAVYTVPFCSCFYCLCEQHSLSAASITLFKVLNCSAVVFMKDVLWPSMINYTFLRDGTCYRLVTKYSSCVPPATRGVVVQLQYSNPATTSYSGHLPSFMHFYPLPEMFLLAIQHVSVSYPHENRTGFFFSVLGGIRQCGHI